MECDRPSDPGTCERPRTVSGWWARKEVRYCEASGGRCTMASWCMRFCFLGVPFAESSACAGRTEPSEGGQIARQRGLPSGTSEWLSSVCVCEWPPRFSLAVECLPFDLFWTFYSTKTSLRLLSMSRPRRSYASVPQTRAASVPFAMCRSGVVLKRSVAEHRLAAVLLIRAKRLCT